MAYFQDTRFLGFSSRTVWVSLAVVGVVVGLFFIPEIIKFQFSSRTGSASRSQNGAATKQIPSAAANKPAQTESKQDTRTEQRASLSANALREISTDLEAPTPAARERSQQPDKPESKGKQRSSDGESNSSGGFFSGWNMKVSARGDKTKDSARGLSMDNLSNKDAAAFFKHGKGEVSKFVDKNNIRDTSIRELVDSLLSVIETVGNGLGKNVDQAEIGSQLVRQHVAVVHRFLEAGVERGMVMEWLAIPVIKFIDNSRGGGTARQVQASFAPRIILRSLAVRQKAARAGATDSRGTTSLSAELAVKGSDVESIAIYNGGQRQRDIRPSRPDADGFRTFTIHGDASGMWAFVASDKYGSRPYTKGYMFYPRVRRFRLNDDGTYNIAFQPTSAKNSLDRYFAVAVSRNTSSRSSDPAVTIF